MANLQYAANRKFLVATHLASLRRANEANQPRPPISTPAEFSRLKYERELKLQERQEQYRQQMIAHQRVCGIYHVVASGIYANDKQFIRLLWLIVLASNPVNNPSPTEFPIATPMLFRPME
jgi:chromatin modification-related protein VID21